VRPAIVLAACATLAVATPAAAQPTAAPPSHTLERAIKLYDKVDYYSASIELTKVTSGETGDDPPNVARAEFFTAKTLVRLGFNAASLTWFQKTLPPHPYNEAAVKWLVDQMQKLPSEDTRQLLQSYPLTVLDAPMLSDEERAWFAYFRGAYAVLLDNAGDAEALLARVPAGTQPWARGQLALAELRLRRKDLARGVAHALAAAADPATALDAVRLMSFWTRHHAQPEAARAAYEQLAAGTDAAAGAAALALSRLDAEKRNAALVGAGDAVFEGVMLAAVCPNGRTDDALADAAAVAARAVKLFEKLEGLDDKAELGFAIARHLAASADPAEQVLAVLFASPRNREAVGWHRALTAELELISQADRAWQTTQTAADILQTVTVHHALAEADLGGTAKGTLRDALPYLRALASAGESGTVLSAGPTDTLVVTPALCAAAIGVDAPAIATGAQALPTTPTTKPHGCGCAASGARGPGGVLAIALAVLVVVARPRRRR
jgi:MYXO-CTERM domain-containing protein